jgi:hypothetical protein
LSTIINVDLPPDAREALDDGNYVNYGMLRL